jgi:hypothetical protein
MSGRRFNRPSGQDEITAAARLIQALLDVSLISNFATI